MNSNKIKNLLFDLGGVIMDIEKERCARAFESLGMTRIGEFLGDYSQKGPFALIESGAIDAATFRNEIRALMPPGIELSDKQINDAFTQFLIGIPVQRLRDLRKLQERYRIFLLSNTNPIMWEGKIAEDFKQEGLDINAYFEGTVTSFEAKSMKPDRHIFDYAASKLGINPSETLFLDDSQANCDASTALGWNAALVAPGVEFIDIVNQLDKA
jgi:putative hydrolase of the HAD superfamily